LPPCIAVGVVPGIQVDYVFANKLLTEREAFLFYFIRVADFDFFAQITGNK
jgi:hypothetical protein